MVQPVTGPFTYTSSQAYFSQTKQWYRQKRPYNLPLTYSMSWGAGFTDRPTDDSVRMRLFAETMNGSTEAYAKAYTRLVEKLGDTAGLGINLAQWRQADDMIRARANQLKSFTVQLARRNPVGVAASLGLRLRDVKRVLNARHGASKKLSNLWLEFWFGWKPLVSDIYSALEVFDNEVPWSPIRVSATVRNVWDQVSGPPSSEHIHLDFLTRARIGVELRVVNPNVFLLQQFGLLNPLSVAWDAVPWSFVLDWFTNAGAWLGSLTDFAGLEVRNGYISRRCMTRGKFWWPAYPAKGGDGFGVAVSRSLFSEVPRPALQFKAFRGFSPVRGLTAISLLIQKLPR